jgi:hypothetical protein
MLRIGNLRKRRIYEIKTQKNNCLWSQINLKVVKWNECLEEKAWSKLEWKTEAKRNWTLETIAKIPKCKERNWKLIKYWKNQIWESILKSKY